MSGRQHPARSGRRVAALVATGLLTACAAPRQAEILIATTPPGADCTLTRDGQKLATAGPTPAIALVAPGSGAVSVACRRPGFGDATATLAARQDWPDLDLFLHGTPPFDYPSRIVIALPPKPR